MPLYTYRCEKCDNEVEELNSVAGRFDGPDCQKMMKNLKMSYSPDKRCGGFCRLAISAPAHPVMNPSRPVHKPYNM